MLEHIKDILEEDYNHLTPEQKNLDSMIMAMQEADLALDKLLEANKRLTNLVTEYAQRTIRKL